MTIIKKIGNYIHHPNVGLNVILNCIAPLIRSDELFLRMKWKLRMNYPLDLEHPKTYNEKLQWLKLHDRKPIYTTMVDKYEAKKYVAEIIGQEYIIPTLAVYDRVEDIDFDALPHQFVLKCTHDSGGIVICRDKDSLDRKSALKKLRKALKRKYYWQNREWPYKNVKPRIIAEQYMEDESGYELKDYKFFCFNGVPRCLQVDFDRFKAHKRNFYDLQWNFIDFQLRFLNDPDLQIVKPINFETMKEISYRLSNGIPHVRVDLYNVKGKIYFGELTFYHGSGLEQFNPEKWDDIMGEWLELPMKATV